MKISVMVILMTLSLAIFSSCEKRETINPEDLVPKTVDEDPTIPSIYVNNALFHSETFGNPNNPMIVVLHGGPGGDYRSILNCSEFAKDRYFVVFYDQRGSGLSQRFDADVFTIPQYIEDLSAVIEYYKTAEDQQVILMGHSWGAMLAAAYVNEYPNQIDGLIVMEPGGLKMSDMEEYVENWMSYNLFNENTSDMLYINQVLTAKNHDVLDYKVTVSPDFGSSVGNAGRAPFWRFGAVCNRGSFEYVDEHSFDFTTNLNQFSPKVLFAYSELNPAYGKQFAELIASDFSNVQLVEIEDAGHEIPYYGWENYYKYASEYLNEITIR